MVDREHVPRTEPAAEQADDARQQGPPCRGAAEESGMQYGKILRSPHPYARLAEIDTEKAKAYPGKKKNTKSVDLVAKLFDEVAPKYADRNGGYTRIVKIGQRKGDAAMEVLIELV